MESTKKNALLRLTESMEDYLEEIYDQTNDRQVARVRDIAGSLDVSMSSVTGALKKLSQKGLINYDKYQYITLTEEGRELAAEIKGRHRILTRFLEEAMGVEPERAESNACRMEHALDREVINRFLAVVEFLETHQDFGAEWIKRFHTHVKAREAEGEGVHTGGERHLTELKSGDRASITRIEHARMSDNRIANFGLLPGVTVEITEGAGENGKITLEANGDKISLTRGEGEGIHVRKIKS